MTVGEQVALRVEDRTHRRFITVVRVTELDALAITQRLEESSQPVAVVLAKLMTVRVGRGVPVREMWEMLGDEWEVSRPRRAAEAERTGVDVRRAGGCDRTHQCRQVIGGVGNSRKNGHDVDADIDPTLPQTRDGAEPRFGRRCARLDESREIPTKRDERDVDREVRAGSDTLHDVHVPRDERALRDDDDRQPCVLGERLEHATRYAKATFGWLVRVGSGTNHDDFATGERREARTPRT